MTLKIDSAGRIILPKPVRDRLGVRAGADLELVETAEGLVLKPASQRSLMLRVDGFWVHQGAAPKDFDWSRFMEAERDERHRRIFGL